jgi:hypothetical protein
MPFLFNMSIPGDAVFLEPLVELAVKVAEYAGYEPADASEIAAAIRAGTAEVIGLTTASPVPIEIVFQTRDAEFEVAVSYEDGSGRPATPQLAQTFQCEHKGHRTVCRMSRSLPDHEPGG